MEAKETEHQEYFTPEDFMIGNTVTMMNRRFLIYDMDKFTQEFYRYNYGIKSFEPVPVGPPACDAPKMVNDRRVLKYTILTIVLILIATDN